MKTLIKWKPKKELWIVLLSWALVVAVFYLSFRVITIQRVAAQFITFGVVGIMLLGVMAPVLWSALVKKRTLAAVGIRKDKLFASIVLCIVLSVIQYFMTLGTIALPGLTELVPLAAMAVAVGFFENIFFRGWAQQRFEESFGIVPGILLSAIIYSLYHVGYGMEWAEMFTLFIIGLVYSIVFRVTGNIFIVFPFLTPLGAMFTNIKEGLTLPFEATYGFVLVIGFIIAGLVVVQRLIVAKKVEAKGEIDGVRSVVQKFIKTI